MTLTDEKEVQAGCLSLAEEELELVWAQQEDDVSGFTDALFSIWKLPGSWSSHPELTDRPGLGHGPHLDVLFPSFPTPNFKHVCAVTSLFFLFYFMLSPENWTWGLCALRTCTFHPLPIFAMMVLVLCESMLASAWMRGSISSQFLQECTVSSMTLWPLDHVMYICML